MRHAMGIPPALAGRALEVCGVPAPLAKLLHARGLSASDAIGNCFTDAGHAPISLRDEFAGAMGYRFDWGWVIPGMPPWYPADDSVGWRFVPIALWSDLGRGGRLHDTVPNILHSCSRNVFDYLCEGPFDFPNGNAPYGSLEAHVLPHAIFALYPNDGEGVGLARWLERDLLPVHMGKLLRLLRSTVLREIHSHGARVGGMDRS